MFFENPKNTQILILNTQHYPNCWRNTLIISSFPSNLTGPYSCTTCVLALWVKPQFDEQFYPVYWKLFGNFIFTRYWKWADPKKYQNFISARNYREDPKNTKIRLLYPKKYDEHTYHFNMEFGGGGGGGGMQLLSSESKIFKNCLLNIRRRITKYTTWN